MEALATTGVLVIAGRDPLGDRTMRGLAGRKT